jgi:hypothetical protein
MCQEQRWLLLLCVGDVGLAASWLSTLLGPVAKLATVAAGVVWCRLWLASSLLPSFAWFATLVASYHGRRLPLLPVSSVDLPLLPSEVEPPANGDRSGPEVVAVDG